MCKHENRQNFTTEKFIQRDRHVLGRVCNKPKVCMNTFQDAVNLIKFSPFSNVNSRLLSK